MVDVGQGIPGRENHSQSSIEGREKDMPQVGYTYTYDGRDHASDHYRESFVAIIKVIIIRSATGSPDVRMITLCNGMTIPVIDKTGNGLYTGSTMGPVSVTFDYDVRDYFSTEKRSQFVRDLTDDDKVVTVQVYED